MKILFICKEMDSHLEYRVNQLTNHGFEVECLELLTQNIVKNGEKYKIELDNKFSFLEKSAKLKNFSKKLMYRQLFSSILNYDTINIYKTASLTAPYIDIIKKHSKSFYVTIEEDITNNRDMKKLLESSYCILFDEELQLESFEEKFGYDEKTLIAHDSNHFFELIDSISKDELEKFKNYLNISDKKYTVYCDLGNDINIQKEFIDDVLDLPTSLLQKTTFIFNPVSTDIIDKEMLVEYLVDKKFDYLMPDSLLTDKQKAMLLILSNGTIILNGYSEYSSLKPSFYVENHVYRYGTKNKNPKYEKLQLFIDNFDNFENTITFNQDSVNLINELTHKNKEIITKLYHPNNTLENYLKIMDIL